MLYVVPAVLGTVRIPILLVPAACRPKGDTKYEPPRFFRAPSLSFAFIVDPGCICSVSSASSPASPNSSSSNSPMVFPVYIALFPTCNCVHSPVVRALGDTRSGPVERSVAAVRMFLGAPVFALSTRLAPNTGGAKNGGLPPTDESSKGPSSTTSVPVFVSTP